jgi:hypothetical protein
VIDCAQAARQQQKKWRRGYQEAQVKRRVIGIVRVSTPGQVGEDKYGLGRQRHDIEQTARAHDLDIVRWCEVAESGTTAFRNEDFADLARPDIAGAVVSALDRLVRPGFLGDLQALDPFQRHKKLRFAGGVNWDSRRLLSRSTLPRRKKELAVETAHT